jgi:hypothetical protein
MGALKVGTHKSQLEFVLMKLNRAATKSKKKMLFNHTSFFFSISRSARWPPQSWREFSWQLSTGRSSSAANGESEPFN